MTRTTRSGLLLATVAGLLVFSPALADAYVLPKLFSLSAGAALAWFGLFRAPLRRTALDLPLAALWLVMAASAATSADWTLSVFGVYPQAFYGLIPLALCTALYYAAAMSPDGPAADEILRAALYAAVAVCLYGISQRLFGDLLAPFPLPEPQRITATMGNPVMLGACLVLLCPVALHWSLTKKGWLGPVAGVLLGVALVLTLARAAWLSAAVSAAAYLWLSGRVRANRRLVLALVVCAPLLFLGLQRAMRKRDSDILRAETAKTAVAAFLARPVLGYGPDTFMFAFRRHKTDEFLRVAHSSPTIQFSAHNDFLQAAATLGGLGLLAYLWLLAALTLRLRGGLAAAPGGGRVAAVSAGLIGLFVQAKFNPIPISALALAAVMTGLVVDARKASRPHHAGKAISSLATCLCVALALLYVRFIYADHLLRRGRDAVYSTSVIDARFMEGVNSLRRAAELNPWVVDYLMQRCETIFRVAPAAPKELGAQLLEKARAITLEGIRVHPLSPAAHELRATALALSYPYGFDALREAMTEIDLASSLDPTFVFSLRRRLQISSALGDRAEFERALREYQRVIALTRDDPQWRPLF